ncbi:hypothetical protein [Streptomyces africanus]|uniref:hypothetical protein n=1 Tax=Streptomyces africanus TaxID=231024 RepID=UPI000A382910|nr:hypothetical protein [Streptomyces africanus]
MDGYGKPGYTREEFEREMDAELDAVSSLDRECQPGGIHHTNRVNELREILRTHRPDTADVYEPVREARARQDAALLANREPESGFRAEVDQLAAAAVDDGLDRLFRRLGPPTEN